MFNFNFNKCNKELFETDVKETHQIVQERKLQATETTMAYLSLSFSKKEQFSGS